MTCVRPDGWLLRLVPFSEELMLTRVLLAAALSLAIVGVSATAAPTKAYVCLSVCPKQATADSKARHAYSKTCAANYRALKRYYRQHHGLKLPGPIRRWITRGSKTCCCWVKTCPIEGNCTLERRCINCGPWMSGQFACFCQSCRDFTEGPVCWCMGPITIHPGR